MNIKKITQIHGATDILFDNGLRIWCPPNNSRPYFTQPAVVTQSQQAKLPAGIPGTENPYAHFKVRDLTESEEGIIGKYISGEQTKKAG